MRFSISTVVSDRISDFYSWCFVAKYCKVIELTRTEGGQLTRLKVRPSITIPQADNFGLDVESFEHFTSHHI